MDGSLWLLARLRLGGLYRRWRRSLSRPRGILVTIAFLVLFAPSLIGTVAIGLFAPGGLVPTAQLERFGPILFAALMPLSLLGSAREAALYYAPAEVDFLFAGPFRRRDLIASRLIMAGLASLLSALFLGCSSRVLATWFTSAVVAAVLAVAFVQLVQVVVTLTIELAGALLWGRVRWAVAAVAIVLAALAVLPSRDALAVADWRATALAVERSTAALICLAPFRPFVFALTAHSWPSLLGWGGSCLAIDGVLVILVFALDAGYVEAGTVASGRRLALARKMIGAGGTFRVAGRSTGPFRLRPMDAPWWGGVGPNLWRQMIAALGDPIKLAVILVAVGGIGWGAAVVMPRKESPAETLLSLGLSLAVPLTLLLGMVLSFDFRGDLDVMETLKALPIRPTRLALGQVLAPALLATLVQGTACLGMIHGLGWPAGSVAIGLTALAFLLPGNLFYFEVENLLFLLYPSRLVAGQFNGMVAVRQMILMLAKAAAVGAGGLAVGAVATIAYAVGAEIATVLTLAWIPLVGLAVALLPFVGRAFARFDVIHDIPA